MNIKEKIAFLIMGVAFLRIIIGLGLYIFSEDPTNVPPKTSVSKDLSEDQPYNFDIKENSTTEKETDVPILEEEIIKKANLDLDFEKYKDINNDFLGIIYIPVLDKTYPFVKSKDNEDYLETAFDGTANKAGTIFMEKSMASDFSLPNTYLYGHNQKDGSMFGSLKRFIREEDLCEQNPYIYIFTPTYSYKFEIFSYCVIPIRDDIYQTISYNEYDKFVEKALSRSNYKGYKNDINFDDKPNLLTLATCYGVGHLRNLVVHSALVKKEFKYRELKETKTTNTK